MKDQEAEAILTYTHQEAIEDGVLVEIFKNRWSTLSGGVPIFATNAIFVEFSMAGIMEIWNEYVLNQKKDPKEIGDPFVTKMNSKDVWVINDG